MTTTIVDRIAAAEIVMTDPKTVRLYADNRPIFVGQSELVAQYGDRLWQYPDAEMRASITLTPDCLAAGAVLARGWDPRHYGVGVRNPETGIVTLGQANQRHACLWYGTVVIVDADGNPVELDRVPLKIIDGGAAELAEIAAMSDTGGGRAKPAHVLRVLLYRALMDKGLGRDSAVEYIYTQAPHLVDALQIVCPAVAGKRIMAERKSAAGALEIIARIADSSIPTEMRDRWVAEQDPAHKGGTISQVAWKKIAQRADKTTPEARQQAFEEGLADVAARQAKAALKATAKRLDVGKALVAMNARPNLHPDLRYLAGLLCDPQVDADRERDTLALFDQWLTLIDAALTAATDAGAHTPVHGPAPAPAPAPAKKAKAKKK